MALVTENWRQRAWRPGSSGAREFEVSEVANEAAALAALAVEGIIEGAAWPIVAGDPISISKGGIEVTRNGRNYVVKVNYSPGESGGGTVIDQKWRCRLSWLIEERAMLKDGGGRAVVNSNRDPLQTNLTRRRKVPMLEMVRNETGTDIISKTLNFSNKWNDAPVTFPKIGTAAAGEALLDTIEVVEDFTSASTYLRVMYRFIFRPRLTLTPPGGGAAVQRHGFYSAVPDVGFNAWDGTVSRRIVWGEDQVPNALEPVPFAVMLNGKGVPLDTRFKLLKMTSGSPGAVAGTARTGESPTYYTSSPADGTSLYYDQSDGEASFSGLSIAANI